MAPITEILPRGRRGPYQVHGEAETVEDPDWPQVLALYGALEQLSDSPVVRLDRAVSAVLVHGPEAGLRMVAEPESSGRLTDHHRIQAVRAHLLETAGEPAAAARDYRAATARRACRNGTI